MSEISVKELHAAQLRIQVLERNLRDAEEANRRLAKHVIKADQRVSDLNGEVLRLGLQLKHHLQLQAERDALAAKLAEIEKEVAELTAMNSILDDALHEALKGLDRLAELEGQEPALYVQSNHVSCAKYSPFLGRICQQPFDGIHQTAYFARPVPAEPVNARLLDIAAGKLSHLYAGLRPDSVSGSGSRDPECPACRAIAAAEAQQSDQVARPALMTIEQARDSERYAYLRSQHEGSVAASFAVFAPEQPIGEFGPVGSMPGELDAAIDAAIRANGYKVEG